MGPSALLKSYYTQQTMKQVNITIKQWCMLNTKIQQNEWFQQRIRWLRVLKIGDKALLPWSRWFISRSGTRRLKGQKSQCREKSYTGHGGCTRCDLIEIRDGKGLWRQARALPLPITEDLHPCPGSACHITNEGTCGKGARENCFCLQHKQPMGTSAQGPRHGDLGGS